MKNSISNSLLLTIYEKGYRMDKEGNVYNHKFVKLNPYLVKNSNYLKITVWDKSRWDKPKRINVHRLQAYQKFGDKIFEEGIVVRHLDGNPLNNSWENIEIGTSSDNQMDRNPECRKKHATNASRKMQDSVRSYEERCKIYEKLKNGISYRTIEKENNIRRSALSFMKNKSIEYKEYLNK